MLIFCLIMTDLNQSYFQNLSKTEAASNESKKLHKSGSLSQVCSEVASGARSKVRKHFVFVFVCCTLSIVWL